VEALEDRCAVALDLAGPHAVDVAEGGGGFGTLADDRDELAGREDEVGRDALGVRGVRAPLADVVEERAFGFGEALARIGRAVTALEA
jgi:hypothetical protein